MDFEIPTQDLSLFSVSGLERFRADARTEYQTLFASAQENPDATTDEQIARLEALRNFEATAKAEVEGRNAREARLEAMRAADEAELAASAAAAAAVVATGTEVAETSHTPAESTPVEREAPATITASIGIADVAGANSVTASTTSAPSATFGTLVAAADVPGHSMSQELVDMDAVAEAFLARTAGYRGMTGTNAYASHGVAVFKREYPEDLTVYGDQRDKAVLDAVVQDSRLPGGSLVAATRVTPEDVANGGSLTAAVGWCAPSTTIYDTCLQVTTDGLASFPEVVAARGGIRHNTGITFSSIFGGGSGYFNYTEAQIISGVTKPCLTIDCPSFVDTRLGVTGLCLTGNILQNRAYPEYVSTFVRGALAASAHQINMLQIAAVVTGSTPVDLTGSASFVGDGTVVSQFFAAIDLAITDIKYNLRLDRNASLEVKLPFWLLAQFRADWSRRNAVSDPNLADAVVSAWFAARNASPDFVYDWQDAFSSAGVGPGASTAITALPTSLVFLVYPTGTWVRAVSDVITLNSIYDSTKLASNQVTQLFTEQGWAMAQMCPLSRAYTVNICPSGETGAQRVSSNTITC